MMSLFRDKSVKLRIFVFITSDFLFMENFFSEEAYGKMIEELFCRFPSFQKVGTGAYKPGIANMEFADQLMGHPHRKYKIIHVAGTNGKGSVSSMLASVLASAGLKVGLYTSPHILDFRERARIVNNDGVRYITKEFIWDFYGKWKDMFDHMDMSLFEISTLMAFEWFANEGVSAAVVETGMGGRLDSTNIVDPVLTVITNIGLDHCNILGDTLPEIAYEKAGIIKPCVPVVVGESHAETDPVFERKVLYTNLPESRFMGDKTAVMSLLKFADKTVLRMGDKYDEILDQMDLKGDYQSKNLRTAMAALEFLTSDFDLSDEAAVMDALVHTALRTELHGRWEEVSDCPRVICDIGHNVHGLKPNMKKLSEMLDSGEVDGLVIVYGIMSDKDFFSVADLLPEAARYVFTSAPGIRALSADVLAKKYEEACSCSGRNRSDYEVEQDPVKALRIAVEMTRGMKFPLIYVGGSTYVVAEVLRSYKIDK